MQCIFFVSILFQIGVLANNEIHYDTFTGKILSDEEYKQYVKANITFWCSGTYKPCDPTEGRRLDTTCNNLNFPYRGPPHTPSSHDLPLEFSKGNTPKRTKCGAEPGLARKERMTVLMEGSVPDSIFSANFVHYMLFMVNGVASIHDTINYVRWVTYCCQPKGKTDPQCAPMLIPADDYVHQFSGIRCMNMTKPFTFQSVGCIKDNTTTPERINSASNFLDLSIVYGFDNKLRLMKDGLLEYDVDEDGRVWPASNPNYRLYCLLNEPPRETRCHKNVPTNGLVGTNFFSIIFLRLHNYIAMRLKTYNPCWDDEKLFNIARDINIAISSQIYYYEVMPLFMGKKNLIRDGVISPDGGFRNTYDKTMVPQVSTEYVYGLRWGHTVQPGQIRMYDCNGYYIKQIPSVNLTLRTGYYAIDDNMAGITQSFFRQPASKIDHVVDPFLAETGLGKLQYAFDITSADLIKGGLLGIASYVDYRRLCTGKKYRSFNDLADDIAPEYIFVLKTLYKNVEDIPLMAGIWVEKSIPGGYAPRTLYCIKAKQMKRFARYDRHWYESPTRPNAFNQRQLAEIRKATIAWVFCTVGDSVTKIQPQAFLLFNKSFNKITSCDNIPKIDFTAWVDAACYMGTERY